MSGVDVLAVMEGIVPNTRFSAFTGDDLDEARAAVAELIEKAEAVLSHNPAHYDTDEEAALRDALANVTGGAA